MKIRRPEVLAPAGDRDAMAAALAAGADAVYFGLDEGFNARARAENFPVADLAATVAWIHRAGARAFVTLNTLVFEPELGVVEVLIRACAEAGVDAIIVQDPAICALARALCPQLEVHGSTQMTASSGLAAELLGELGLTRIVVPRELSVADIALYAEATRIPLEVFVHGALCVAWSGQCLSSEAWGGRSANRGQCAQACRLPYDLVVDGTVKPLGDVKYLLSPKDLVGIDSVSALAKLGVASLKIEGRLKGPAYVATAAAQYRAAAAAAVGEPMLDLPIAIPDDRASLVAAYSRGSSAGFLGGVDHQTLVEGRFPRHRGLPLGRVTRVEGDLVTVVADPAQRPVTGALALDQTSPATAMPEPRFEPRAGVGIVFDHGTPERDETGGPIFGVESMGADTWRLRFGRPGPDLSRVAPGDFVWASSDPKVTRAGEKAVAAGREPLGRIALSLVVRGEVGGPLHVAATIESGPATGRTAIALSTSMLAAARGGGLDDATIAEKLCTFGGTPFVASFLDLALLGSALHLPVSELKAVRRALVTALDAEVVRVERVVAQHSVIEQVREGFKPVAPLTATAVLVPLCRTDAQLDAALEAGAREVELDWMELVGLGKAVARAQARGARVGVATVRVQKPGEERIDAHLWKLAPDHLLVRSWGSLAALERLGHAGGFRPALHGDFSLNVTNSITAAWVLGHPLETITAAHDLDRDQLLALLDVVPAGRVAVTIHHHIPTFHTEHCVYAHLLSHGADYRTCGRPCEQHQIALADRVGHVHPVVVDVGCRNTVFNAQAQSAASLVPALLARGVQRFRLELVRETAAEASCLVEAYTQLVAGALEPAEVVRRAAVHEQFGVTRGTMRTLAVLA